MSCWDDPEFPTNQQRVAIRWGLSWAPTSYRKGAIWSDWGIKNLFIIGSEEGRLFPQVLISSIFLFGFLHKFGSFQWRDNPEKNMPLLVFVMFFGSQQKVVDFGWVLFPFNYQTSNSSAHLINLPQARSLHPNMKWLLGVERWLTH